MEANYESREQMRREVEEVQEEEAKGGKGRRTATASASGEVDPMAKAKQVIRESIISGEKDGTAAGGRDESMAIKEPDDILVYSRSVHDVDSSLE